MKKLKFFIPLLALMTALSACQKENLTQEQMDTQPEVLALKKHPVPFRAEFVSTVLSTAPNPEVCDGMGAPVFNLLQSLEGTATHLGNITGSVSSCIDPVAGVIFNGEVVFVAANGDELYFFQSGPLAFDINGGTGRFEDAMGSITGFFELINPGPPLQFYNEFNGKIQY